MSNITENSELGRRQKNETKAKCILEGSTRITTFKFCFYFNYENNSIFGWLSVSPWDLTKIPNFRLTFVFALTQKVAKWTSSFRNIFVSLLHLRNIFVSKCSQNIRFETFCFVYRIKKSLSTTWLLIFLYNFDLLDLTDSHIGFMNVDPMDSRYAGEDHP